MSNQKFETKAVKELRRKLRDELETHWPPIEELGRALDAIYEVLDETGLLSNIEDEPDLGSTARRDAGCPFCHLLHDYERSDCHGHDGKRLIYIRQKGPMTAEEKERLSPSLSNTGKDGEK